MKNFCIIGLGRFGQTLAKALVRNGHEVVIVDEDEESVNALADYVSDAVIGDPTNEAVLRQACQKSRLIFEASSVAGHSQTYG